MSRSRFLLLLIVAGALVAAFATGVLNWHNVRGHIIHETYQMEAKLHQVAQSGQPTAADLQAAEICRQNLRRLESAKRAIASRGEVTVGTISWDAVLREMKGQRPVCPRGGTYTLRAIGSLPRCSIETNGTPSPADDHAITHY